MSQYFLVRNGQTIGPFPIENLPGYQLGPQEVVWKEGFQNWIPARDVKEISEFMQWPLSGPMSSNPTPQPFSGNPRPQPQSSRMGEIPKRQTGLLVMGIIGIIFSLAQSFFSFVFIVMGIEMQDRSYYREFGNRDEGGIIAGIGAFTLILGIFFLILSIIAVVNASQKRVRA